MIYNIKEQCSLAVRVPEDHRRPQVRVLPLLPKIPATNINLKKGGVVNLKSRKNAVYNSYRRYFLKY